MNNGKLKPWLFLLKGKALMSMTTLFSWAYLILFLLLKKAYSTPLLKDPTLVAQDSELNYSLYFDEDVSLDSLTSLKLYWKLVELIQVSPSARYKCTSLFTENDLDWDVIYLIPHLVTLDTKTKIFFSINYAIE